MPVHFIYHVPKCAGQTIDRHLAAALPGGAYYRTQKRRGLRRLLQTRHDPRHMPKPGRTRVVGGHYLGISVEPLFAGQELQRSILLRDPVSHIVSYYNFRMMRYISQGLHPYSFEIAYEATQRNFVTHYILRNFLELPWAKLVRLSDEEKYDIVNAFLGTFWYVADYRLCDDLIASLGSELGISASAAARNTCAEWQSQVDWKAVGGNDLSAETIARIRSENLIDQRLWETWRVARHDAASIRPVPLGARRTSPFLKSEMRRLLSQIARRTQRRWGAFEGPALPLPEGGSPVPV